MNKSEIANRINQPTEKIDAILKDAGLPVDVEHYSPEQIESLEAIAKMVETKQAKNFKDAGGLHRKIQNEAQLNEIALRYSMSDRISEITSVLKLKHETITDEQFEQVRVVCEQVQQGMDLQMVANAQLDKGKIAKAKPAMPKFASQQEPGSAIAPTKDKPMPGLVPRSVQPVDLTGIPVDDGVANNWDDVAKVGAASDADTLAGAPFDGIIEGSEYVNDKTEALKQHGFNLYMEKFDEAMHDPELAKRVEDKYLGKFPAHWNLDKLT